MKQLTELEILRHEVELLRRKIKSLEEMNDYDRRRYQEDIERLLSTVNDRPLWSYGPR